MEILRWHCYIAIVNFAILIPGICAKPFSLNEAIKAEQKAAKLSQLEAEDTAAADDLQLNSTPFLQKSAKHISTRQSLPDSISERISLRDKLKKPVIFKHSPFKYPKLKKATGFHTLQEKNLSPLKYRKLFQLDIPLKPKELHVYKPLLTRKEQSIKRETRGNERFNPKYNPLLRNLGMLFDDLFTVSNNDYESGESYQNRDVAAEASEPICACRPRSDGETKQDQKTAASSSIITAEIKDEPEVTAETTDAPTHHTTLSYISSFRQNTIVPLLLARNTTGRWRNNFRLRPRSSTTFHASTERNITRDNGNSENNARNRRNGTDAADNEEDTSSTSRDSASDDGASWTVNGNGDDVASTIYWNGIRESEVIGTSTVTSETENPNGEIGRYIEKFAIETKFETTRNQTAHPDPFAGRPRGRLSENQVGYRRQPIQSLQIHEESVNDVTGILTSNKRLTIGNGPLATKNQEVHGKNEAIISISDLHKLHPNKYDIKNKTVTIIDGYSVARVKNQITVP